MQYKFNVEFLEPAIEFLDSLYSKSREKVLYTIWKSRGVNNAELFKKLKGEIWEFRTLYNKQYIRLFAFLDQTDNKNTIVVSTNGLIKKTDKTPNSEIEKAETLRVKYFKEKK
jgi:phage-related protein